VSILPGIYASQITGHLVTGSYDSIATQTVSGSSTYSVVFNSIPSTYKHLQLRVNARMERTSATLDTFFVGFNGDTASYQSHYIIGNGTAASAAGDASNPPFGGLVPGSSAAANTFSPSVIDILDYQNTNKYKTVRSLSGADLNGSGQIRFSSALWTSTSAINSITINDNNGTWFWSAGSSFALYGIK